MLIEFGNGEKMIDFCLQNEEKIERIFQPIELFFKRVVSISSGRMKGR